MAFNGLQIIRLTFPLPSRNCMAKKQITALIVDFNTRWSIFPENRILERPGSPGHQHLLECLCCTWRDLHRMRQFETTYIFHSQTKRAGPTKWIKDT